MKKNKITLKITLLLAVSIFLVSTPSFLLAKSNEQGEQSESSDHNIQSDTSKKISSQACRPTELAELTELAEIDELDELSRQAEENGVKIEPLAQPSYLMSLVRKYGVIFFLKPYICIVNNYRIAKNFIIKYATIYAKMVWEQIFGKEPGTENNGKKQEQIQKK